MGRWNARHRSGSTKGSSLPPVATNLDFDLAIGVPIHSWWTGQMLGEVTAILYSSANGEDWAEVERDTQTRGGGENNQYWSTAGVEGYWYRFAVSADGYTPALSASKQATA